MLIITQNLWFDNHEREARMQAQARLWQELQPDVICVQEATLACLRHLLPLISNFKSTVSIESSAQWQGVVVFSRTEPQQVDMLALPGEMGRRLLRVRFNNLEIGVVHLESTASAAPTRELQLKTVFAHLSARNSLLVGDFNFCSTSDENARLPADWVDLWPLMHPGQPGWSLDSQQNKLLRGPKQARYDRMLLRSLDWRCQSIDLIRNGASDHFGLVGRLEWQG
ncbi:endonuclease/exonuclease/phosphatase family protein [bacterium]|nr:endonuclease/exonuclease/phosphatase family protein [bacterium]